MNAENFDISVASKADIQIFSPSYNRNLQIRLASWLAVAYADIFDYPLTAAEIQRGLVGMAASLEEIDQVLSSPKMSSIYLQKQQGFYTLPGREQIISTRQRRAEVASILWPQALHYGRILSSLPYVRMVAITGALAVNNVEPGADIDYLIVTQSGRLWLCRAITILVVRWAALKRIVICPNYFLTEDALRHPNENLYTAHELTQMIPLNNMSIYLRMRFLNRWTNDFLPNSWDPPGKIEIQPQIEVLNRFKRKVERALNFPSIDWLERWEMERKIVRFNHQKGIPEEAAFCKDWCKGHIDGHQQRALAAFSQRKLSMPSGLFNLVQELPPAYPTGSDDV